MPDYVPSNDEAFNTWLANFLTALNDHLVDFGLVAGDVAALTAARAQLAAAITDYATLKAQAQSASSAKKTAHESAEGLLRPLVRQINNHPAMTNDLRSLLGLPQRDTVRTSANMGEEVPDLFLEAVPGKVYVHFGTMPGNEMMNGKPAGVKGCNIYRKKAGEEDFTLLAFETASPYVDVISGPAADYTYIVQYRGTRSTDVGNSSSPMTIGVSGLLAA